MGGAVFDDDPNGVRVGCDLPNIAGYVVSARGRVADLQVQPIPNPIYNIAMGRYNAVVSDVIRLAEVDTRQHDIRLEVQLHDPLPAVQIDAVQIQQVVLNLIRNATDAMENTEPERRIVRVRTFPTAQREIQIDVSDNGIGLPSDTAELYNPFFTTKATGIGLGLSISPMVLSVS